MHKYILKEIIGLAAEEDVDGLVNHNLNENKQSAFKKNSNTMVVLTGL